jgi:hypothetical protein
MTSELAVRPDGLRGKALAAWRQATALQLHAQGYSYDEVAAAVGYANRGTAWKAVHDALKDRVAANADVLRRLELMRLDTLQAAHWPGALEGDVKAAGVVLKVIAQRIRLMALEQDPKASGIPTDLVIIKSDTFVEQLKALVEEDERELAAQRAAKQARTA